MANHNGIKSSKVEFEKRVRAVQEWILQGYATCDIIKQSTITWNVGDRQAFKYYSKAFDEFKEANKQSIESKKAYHIALRKKLFRDLKLKEEPIGARTALRIADSMARIEGVTLTGKHSDEDSPEIGDDSVATMRLPDGTEIEL
jgi:hypothetical protein